MTICSLKNFNLAAGRQIFICWLKGRYILNFNFFSCNCKVVGLGFFPLFLFIEKTEGSCHVTENTRNSICPPRPVEQTGAWQSARGCQDTHSVVQTSPSSCQVNSTVCQGLLDTDKSSLPNTGDTHAL